MHALPIWFVTFSSNDAGWAELIRTLKFTVDKEVVTGEALHVIAISPPTKHVLTP